MARRGARAIVALLAFVAGAAWADSYPARPVRVIVPFAAGGTFDQVARVVSQRLTELWREQVIVDNRPGGGTIIATETTVRSNPDGHTMLLSPNGLAANPSLHSKLPYDTQRDLAAVVLVAAQPMALGTHPGFKAASIKDVIELARAAPNKLSYGTAGAGSGGHLAGEIFKAMAGIQVAHISYKGGNVAMMDVMSNQIPLVMTGLPNLLPQHKAGRIRILAITDAKRSAVAQDIPTIGETVPGYAYRNWFGLVVPAATPRAVTQKINRDVNRVLTTGDARQRLLAQGFEVLGGSSEEFAKIIRDDTASFAKVIRQAGIKAN
jgi:tripartite-type tricarboxylate transporter receptor subunit TctC